MEKRLAAMLGPRQVKALDEIEAEFSNVSQAWRWAVANKAYEAIDQASESLFVYSDMRSREHEGIALLGMARERLTPLLDEEPDPAWERLLLPWYDLVLQSKGRPENTQEIERLAGNSLAAAQKRDDQLGMAYGLILLGHFTEPAKALKMYEQALTLCPRLDDSFWVRIRIGFCHRSLGEHHQELKAFQQSYERGRELGESEKMGWSLFNKSRTEINIGDHVNALAHLREAKTHFHQVSTLLGIIWTNIDLSFLMLLKGDIEEIRSLVEETQEIARDANRSDAIKKETLILLGYIALIEQDYQNAQHTFEETLALHTASPEVSLGMTFVAWELEDYSTAGHYLLDAIRPASPYRIPEMIMLCLPAAALALSDQDEATWAVKLLALASHHPKGPKDLFERWPLLIRLQNELTAAISPQEFDTAWKQGQALNLTETLTKLANHLQIEDDPHKALEKQEPSLPASVRFYLVEPLSEREMEILQLLKTELSGPEIANELTVSLNTVRFHTKNIYSKLQVSSRRSAVHRAIELGL
jgi:DNA-binding CsgD family transcriptional regulator